MIRRFDHPAGPRVAALPGISKHRSRSIASILFPAGVLLAGFLAAQPAGAQSPGRPMLSQRGKETIAVAMNGEYVPTYGLPSVSLAPVSSKFTVSMTPDGPGRRQFQLEGVDMNWQEGRGEATITVGFSDERGRPMIMEWKLMKFEGESPRWNGSLEKPVFATQRMTATVPPNAHSFRFSISSAGPPDTLGTILVKGVTIKRTRGNGPREVILRAPVGNDTRYSPVLPAPLGFAAGGLRPEMAHLLTLPSANGPEECLAIIDDDVRAHAEWMTVKEAAPEVSEGDRLDVEFQEAHSVGTGIAAGKEYARPRPGTYRLRVRPVDVLGQPDGPETYLSICILAPWWQRGWVWALAAAGAIACAFGVNRYLAHQRLRDELARMKEEALRKAEVDLTRMARATTLGEFTASIAHEISQPLAAICTNANACLRWLAPERFNEEEARAATKRIVRDGERAAQIITRIRALLAKEKPQREATNINALIEELLSLLNADIQRREVRLDRFLADGLPAVAIDRVQIQQVIMNLVINGLDAMNGITDRPRVLRISTRLDSGAVVVAVEDSGIGLDPATIGRLFERFFTTKAEGLGMGLAICRSIVESHGGNLVAKPNDGPGATFQFTLPTEFEDIR